MAPPPGLFSTITGWPRLSDSFFPNTRAMMSLPPPAAKPATRGVGLAGDFCAVGRGAGAGGPSSGPQQSLRTKAFIAMFPGPSQPRHVNMQHRRLAVIDRGEAAVDCGGKLVRLGHAFAMGAERLRDTRKIAPLPLTSRHQPRLELIGLGR